MQAIVIAAGLFIGYRLVSNLLSPGTGQAEEKPAAADSPGASHESAWSNPSPPRTPTPLPTWYQILDVAESASLAEIDRAYRRQISQYHPDKVALLGEDIRRLAEARCKDINAAYDAAMRLRR